MKRTVWRKKSRMTAVILAVLLALTACSGGAGSGKTETLSTGKPAVTDGADNGSTEASGAAGITGDAAGAETSGTAGSTGDEAGAEASGAAGSTGDAAGAETSGAAGITGDEAGAGASGAAGSTGQAAAAGKEEDAVREEALAAAAEDLTARMPIEDKIAQMIIPSIRTWDGQDVTDLEAVPGLAAALREHQYGGIILFAMNIVENTQAADLVSALQANNAQNPDVPVRVPYFMPVDEEGGIVLRFNDGTRMTGNMAIGATGERAEENARITGRILGEEMAAMGFNVDFAPTIDVNSNPANPVIGTRSFSDDPETVADLGRAFGEGLAEKGIIATYKHFPGHGDTGTDSHIGTASVEKTYEEMQQTELIPFREVIDSGAEMIMTAHITLPQIDEEMTLGDGQTTGFYPATMSTRVMSEILRGDLGFDGVVVTDALEMDAIDSSGLVPGAYGSVEYHANIAEKCINAGVDLLLAPMDLTGDSAADFYDEYIDTLAAKVNDGTIPGERIDESVERILRLKLKYGILESEPAAVAASGEAAGAENTAAGEDDTAADGGDEAGRDVSLVGSEDHHAAEMEIARQAVTLLKNEGETLPVSSKGKKIVILGREQSDSAGISAAVKTMRENGGLDESAEVMIDYYYDQSGEAPALHYTEDMRAAVQGADYVIGLTRTYSLDALAAGAPQYEGIRMAMEDVHAGGGRFILVSENLPYDAARYQDADAILLAYLGTGLNVDPTEAREPGTVMPAPNANVPAALETVFGANSPTGTLPVNIPQITVNGDGSLQYGEEIFYERGYGLFIE